jgi:twitching motility protein PilT
MIRVSARRELPENQAAFEYSFEQTHVSRFRGHAFKERGGWALALRVVPINIPSFSDLRLPPVVKTLAVPQPGFLLITGPTGSGKSTTAASMIKYAASQEAVHVVSVEDPVEYRVTDVAGCITQREIGSDTPSIADALRDALREDPDVLFIGEIRDREALEVAMHAADTGIMVMSTFHTHSALHTVMRLVSMYPAEEQANARERVADSLRAVISQRLVPRKGMRARVLATEVMINNYTIKEVIRDPARVKALPSILERSGEQQMHSLDQSLLELCHAGLIEAETAATIAASPGNMRRALSLAGLAA